MFEWDDDRDVSIVSEKWVGKGYCYWPPDRLSRSQQQKALMKHKMPEVDWMKYKGRVLSTTGIFAAK